MLFDTMRTELLEKIRRLEEDKQSVDITSGAHTHKQTHARTHAYAHVYRRAHSHQGKHRSHAGEKQTGVDLLNKHPSPFLLEWWSDEVRMKKCKKRSHLSHLERKKKPALVSGDASIKPY